jgi:uncharacterized membrane protein YidH (DUF202 family)
VINKNVLFGVLCIITGMLGAGIALYDFKVFLYTMDYIGMTLTTLFSTVCLFGLVPLGVGAIVHGNKQVRWNDNNRIC